MGAQDQRKPIGSKGHNKGTTVSLGGGDELFSLSAPCSSHSPCSLILPCPFNHRSVPICSSAYQLSSVDASKHNNVKRALYARSDLANKNTGKNCPRTQGKTTIHRTILHKKLVLITLCSSHLRPGKDLQSSRLTCAAALNSEP